MSHYTRDTSYLDKHRIIYRRNPIKDKPSQIFEWGWYYENGTYECYTLFNSKAKINTFKSLKWHLYVLWYLNSQLDQEGFSYIVKHICNIKMGFVTFNVSNQLMENIIYEVSLMDL